MKSKKDILFLCQFFYPEYVSSATLPYDTALALRKAGFSVDALCGYPKEYAEGKDLPKTETVEGIGIRRVPYIQTGRASFLGRLINYFSFTFMILLQLWRLAGYRAVVVYSNPPILPWVASWAKKLFGTKLIFVAYDLYPEIAVRTGVLGEGSLICKLMGHINRCVFRRAEAVVALSTEMREFILQNRPIGEDRVHVIPNWYADQPQPLPEKREAGPFTVSYFGNMGTAQDMQTILDAMKLLKNDLAFRFVFAGHGNKLAHMKQAVQEMGMRNAVFHGFLRGQDFQDALAASDCALISLEKGLTGLCVPSKTYSYMMQGIPLLAIMDDSDIVRHIASGAGQWTVNGDGEALARKLRDMAAAPDELARMRRICRQIYLENYTTPICTGKYVKLLNSLLRKEQA